MNAVTIKDVALAAGVSPATASRVLSGNPATSPAARTRVEAAARELHFLPNAQARSLRSTKTDSIALLISDVRNPYFSDLAHAVEQHARAAGLMTFMGNANESTEQQDEFLATVLSRRVDGMIVVPQGLSEQDGNATEMLRRVVDSGIPMVFVDRTLADIQVPRVIARSREALEEAIAELKSHGHERIAFIGGPKHASTAMERHQAFDAAIAANGLVTAPELHFAGDFRFASGAQGARWFLENPLAPTAVIIADAPMAIGALSVWRERGLNIGTDFSVVSFDEVDALLLHNPPIATISHDLELMGRAAVQALLAVMKNESVAPVELLSTFTPRPSVGPAPDKDVHSEGMPRA
ncbi:LacI family DNA-binding transcriptional regulator [Paeniglutamicibacter terrestris]|uniref:LacI family transcriptional regulator n=1 Tax=Paeniglutamicibacter terrestris TaxID=2723403 RepID=A0ABX1G1F6_9MICC|nr:LacI family DNA-binding transcriptional regulator [Paeniglutamicibacter terrestris]ASN38019.1 LacI family transcriptional regulator [Arthrobacter sp. 7749]NKG19794.1 LacI family transcriptional regulator [Paeniglutamicibacter terrestris]